MYLPTTEAHPRAHWIAMAVAKAAEVLGASFLDIKGVSVLATSLDLVNSIIASGLV